MLSCYDNRFQSHQSLIRIFVPEPSEFWSPLGLISKLWWSGSKQSELTIVMWLGTRSNFYWCPHSLYKSVANIWLCEEKEHGSIGARPRKHMQYSFHQWWIFHIVNTHSRNIKQSRLVTFLIPVLSGDRIIRSSTPPKHLSNVPNKKFGALVCIKMPLAVRKVFFCLTLGMLLPSSVIIYLINHLSQSTAPNFGNIL